MWDGRAASLSRSKGFFAQAFGWEFVDRRPHYAAFREGLDGGVEAENPGAPLMILRADDLEAARDAVVEAGGEFVRPIFAFPGGRRFHSPSGGRTGGWSAG